LVTTPEIEEGGEREREGREGSMSFGYNPGDKRGRLMSFGYNPGDKRGRLMSFGYNPGEKRERGERERETGERFFDEFWLQPRR
jgi:hypothetical protein